MMGCSFIDGTNLKLFVFYVDCRSSAVCSICRAAITTAKWIVKSKPIDTVTKIPHNNDGWSIDHIPVSSRGTVSTRVKRTFGKGIANRTPTNNKSKL